MTPANITALQALVQADPALAQQLQSAASNEAAAKLLAQAASQNGLAVDALAIADYLKTLPTAQMTDAELEGVAGGYDPVPIPLPHGMLDDDRRNSSAGRDPNEGRSQGMK